MKKLLLFLTLPICNLSYSMDQNPQSMQSSDNDRVVLPGPEEIQSCVGQYVFHNFFENTPILSQLAGQHKSEKEVLTILDECSTKYFAKINQPKGREFFKQRISIIAQQLVANRPTSYQYTMAQLLLRRRPVYDFTSSPFCGINPQSNL
jgi:hypothetical protein